MKSTPPQKEPQQAQAKGGVSHQASRRLNWDPSLLGPAFPLGVRPTPLPLSVPQIAKEGWAGGGETVATSLGSSHSPWGPHGPLGVPGTLEGGHRLETVHPTPPRKVHYVQSWFGILFLSYSDYGHGQRKVENGHRLASPTDLRSSPIRRASSPCK